MEKFPKVCIICSKSEMAELTPLEEYLKTCKFPCCGLPDHVCADCKQEGWYSTSGTGGPPELRNSITNQKRTHPSLKSLAR